MNTTSMVFYCRLITKFNNLDLYQATFSLKSIGKVTCIIKRIKQENKFKYRPYFYIQYPTTKRIPISRFNTEVILELDSRF